MEEEGIVLEEMKRVQRYFRWRSLWWQALTKEVGSDAVSKGKRAYALKQEALWPILSSKFLTFWLSELRELDLSVDLINI